MSEPNSERRVRIIPVMDVMEEQVVRAVGGRRELYQPLVSRITHSTDPAVVAAAILRTVAVDELYVADLDGLMGHRPQLGWLRGLGERGVKIMVDSGVRTVAEARNIFEAGASAVVLGTETLAHFNELKTLFNVFGTDRIVLSVDLRNGKVVSPDNAWDVEPEPVEIIRLAQELGIHRVIVLELARVGTGIGPGTVGLCEVIREAFPALELIAGGGVRNREDVNRLAAAGADGVLVASAIHDGHLVTVG